MSGLASDSVQSRAARFAASVVTGLSLAGALAGCDGSPGAAGADALPPTSLPRTGEVGTRLLYDRFDGQVFSYDLATQTEVERGTQEGYSQYAFQPDIGVYTSGDQTGRDFSIIEVDGNSYMTLASLEGRRGVFPLAADRSQRFFSVESYDPQGGQTGDAVAARLETDGSLTRFPLVKKPQGGAMIGADLYFTVQAPGSDRYSLYRVSTKHPDAQPVRVDTGLREAAIFAAGDALYRYTRGRVVGPDRSFPCESDDLCEFSESGDVFVALTVDEDSGLNLTAADTKSGKPLAKVSGVLGYELRGTRLTAYRDGTLETVSLEPK